MELVDREQCCSCVTAARTEAGLFGDSFLQVRGNLKCATPVEWLDGAVEGGPSLLHRVVWSQVRTIRREMELCRRRRKRVEVESIACRDAQKERLQFMKLLAVPFGYHAQPGVDFDPCLHVKVLLSIASTSFCPIAHTSSICLLYTSDAADDLLCVALGG